MNAFGKGSTLAVPQEAILMVGFSPCDRKAEVRSQWVSG
jgi:hypothetical protein